VIAAARKLMAQNVSDNTITASHMVSDETLTATYAYSFSLLYLQFTNNLAHFRFK